MKTWFKIGYIGVLFIFAISFISCSSSTNSQTNPTYATAQLGNLANADVKIYEISTNGAFILKWEEKTSSGDSLDSIGKFNSHSEDMDDNTYYLFEITGGEDWDSDDNGIKDNNYTKNTGTIHSVARGDQVARAGEDFKITIISELLYEKVAYTLKYNFNKDTFGNILQNSTKDIIKDINGDGTIDIDDILTFDPVNDKNSINGTYKDRLDKCISSIHEGKIASDETLVELNDFNLTEQMNYIKLNETGTKAYISTDDLLMILDINNSSEPRILKQKSYSAITKKILLNNDETEMYVLNNTKIDIFNISPSTDGQPDITLKSSFDLNSSYSYDMYINKNNTRAYIATHEGLEILDISDIDNIQSINFYSTSNNTSDSYIKSIEIDEDRKIAIIAIINTAEIQVLDISDENNITQLSTIGSSSSYQKTIIDKDKDILYAITYDELEIYDISDYQNAQLLGTLKNFEGISNFTINQDKTVAYILTIEDRRRGYVSNIFKIDISNPESLTKEYIYTLNYTIARGFALNKNDTRLYIGTTTTSDDCSETRSFKTIDATMLKKPYYNIGNYNPGIKTFDTEINEDETKAYIASSDGSGIFVVDITNPAEPTLVRSIDYGGRGNTYDILLNKDETKAYVGAGNYMYVVEIEDEDNPQSNELYHFDSLNKIRKIVLSNDETKAYVGIDNYLYVLNIENEDNVTESDNLHINCNTSDRINNMILSNDETKIYIASEAGFRVADINKSNGTIRLVGTGHEEAIRTNEAEELEKRATALSLNKDSTKAYLGIKRTESADDFVTVDLNDTSSPSSIFLLDSKIYDISVNKDETKAYLASCYNGITVLDISEPNNPKLLRKYNTTGCTLKIKLNATETKIYAQSIDNGLTIIDLEM